MSNTGGVSEVSAESTKALTDIQIQLARIEETLKPLAALSSTVADIKETAVEALRRAEEAHTRLALLEPGKVTAEDALRKAEAANSRLDAMQEDQKWVKRQFYGPLITSFSSLIMAAIVAYMGLSK
ncbi:alanine-zipper protein [Paenibacillus sp. FSL H8-0168]|jgi:methyl-accepting chemotaxis protein|uniref:alanine-zipper protein n=1 Tax=Paenibacillus sp. FSL H8-0168 TaxID=2921378 RepID=UPI0031585C06